MKRKAGLHKKISTIFDGVPLPNEAPIAGQQRDGMDNTVQPKPIARPSSGLNYPPSAEAPKQHVYTEPAHESPQAFKGVLNLISQSHIWFKLTSKLYGSAQEPLDTRQKVMTVLVPVLLLVFIFIFSAVLNVGSNIDINKKDSGGAVTGSGQEWQINWVKPKPVSGNLRNPMELSTFGRMAGEGDEFIISGIIFSDDPVAIIDGQIVSTGEEIYGLKLIKINKDSVVFEDSDGKTIIRKVGKY
ncbi:MAG: hypothetical protein ABIG61_17585 [Planctomycetota bacterium]